MEIKLLVLPKPILILSCSQLRDLDVAHYDCSCSYHTHLFIMLVTGVYVSQLHAKVTELHNTVVSLFHRAPPTKPEMCPLSNEFKDATRNMS